MGHFAADVRYAARMLRSSPGFTAVAVAALALGIGANTAIFTVVNAVMLQPLPYREPDRIVRLARSFPNGSGYSNSIPKYMAWRQNDVFEAMTLYGQSAPGVNLGSGDRPEQIKSMQVSKDFFVVFGASPALGRFFTDAEDAPGGPSVTVLSYAAWQNRLGDASIVGRTILLNRQPYTVVGVMPKGFESDPPSDVWLPLQADPHSTNQAHYLAAAARLKPGVTLSQARAQMKVVGEQFRRAHPEWMDKAESIAVIPMRDSMVEDARTPLLILLGAVGFVLLIACANVANLLLARAAVRQKELAIRAAMGANRGRVIQQLLTESVMLAGVGAVIGFALGAWGVRALLLVAPGNIPRLTDEFSAHRAIPLMDWRVAAFTVGIAIVTGVLFGLFPALRISRLDLSSTLKEGGRSGAGLHQRARSVLVVSEVALALVLLVGAALLIRTFAGLHSVNPGFNPRGILTLETSLTGGNYQTTARVTDFADQSIRRIESLPGVQAAAAAVVLPLSGNGIDMPFNIVGSPPAKGKYNGDEYWRYVTPHYFKALEVPLLRGRTFNDNDRANSPRVVIINEVMAKRYWPKQDPVGQVIIIGKDLGPQFEDSPREIVGVVGSVREAGLATDDAGVMYIPQSQVSNALTTLADSVIPLSWAIRTTGDPMALRGAVEREIQAVDGMRPVARVRTMEQLISESLTRQNFNMLLLSIFAAIALLLAAIGIYGLMSYSVEQRMQEIGIRMALGAARRDVVRLVVMQGARLAGIGVVAGLAMAYGVTWVMAKLLFGVKPFDAATFGAVAGTVTLVAVIAAYIPARRAAGVEAGTALRHQ